MKGWAEGQSYKAATVNSRQPAQGSASLQTVASEGLMTAQTSKMSMEGWWMVQTTVRPVLTVLRTVRITMAAALASSPLVGSSCEQ